MCSLVQQFVSAKRMSAKETGRANGTLNKCFVVGCIIKLALICYVRNVRIVVNNISIISKKMDSVFSIYHSFDSLVLINIK